MPATWASHKVLVVTDPGVLEVGWAGEVLEGLEAEGLAYSVFSQVTSNPRVDEVMAGWDFDNVWAIVEDTTYPYQRQTAANLALFPTYATYPSSVSATSTITVVANITWTAITDATWITLTGGTSGTDSGVISYTIAANPDPTLRDDVITISSEGAGITLTFQLRQEGTPLPFLTIFPGSRNYNSAASTGHAIDITSNVTWTAQTTAAWITLTSADEGADDGTLSYRLDDNLSLAPRTGTIEIVGGGITHIFTVTQTGVNPYLSLTPEQHHLDWSAAAGHEIDVGTNVPWTAATATDWITVTGGSSGTGDGVITYSVAANLAPASRLGTSPSPMGLRRGPSGCIRPAPGPSPSLPIRRPAARSTAPGTTPTGR